MKKLIFSIAALAAIVVMGSCSKDSDLTNKTAESVGNVTVSLNVNSGIEVSGSSSSLNNQTAKSETSTRAGISTRADVDNETPTTNFAADLSSTTYTAYFVATADQGEYKKGQIVRKISGIKENTATSISIPAISYTVYVTNYDTNAPDQGGQETDVTNLEDNLPESSTVLYLFGKNTADLSSGASQSIQVTLNNKYAAVCVANNDFVTGVAYTPTTSLPSVTAYILDSWQTTETAWNDKAPWYYMYIRADKSATSNSTIALNTANMGGNASTTWPLNNDITADQIYQYTVKSVNGGASLTVTENVFKQINSSVLNVY
jgi:hypothetical protein